MYDIQFHSIHFRCSKIFVSTTCRHLASLRYQPLLATGLQGCWYLYDTIDIHKYIYICRYNVLIDYIFTIYRHSYSAEVKGAFWRYLLISLNTRCYGFRMFGCLGNLAVEISAGFLNVLPTWRFSWRTKNDLYYMTILYLHILTWSPVLSSQMVALACVCYLLTSTLYQDTHVGPIYIYRYI